MTLPTMTLWCAAVAGSGVLLAACGTSVASTTPTSSVGASPTASPVTLGQLPRSWVEDNGKIAVFVQWHTTSADTLSGTYTVAALSTNTTSVASAHGTFTGTWTKRGIVFSIDGQFPVGSASASQLSMPLPMPTAAPNGREQWFSARLSRGIEKTYAAAVAKLDRVAAQATAQSARAQSIAADEHTVQQDADTVVANMSALANSSTQLSNAVQQVASDIAQVQSDLGSVQSAYSQNTNVCSVVDQAVLSARAVENAVQQLGLDEQSVAEDIGSVQSATSQLSSSAAALSTAERAVSNYAPKGAPTMSAVDAAISQATSAVPQAVSTVNADIATANSDQQQAFNDATQLTSSGGCGQLGVAQPVPLPTLSNS